MPSTRCSRSRAGHHALPTSFAALAILATMLSRVGSVSSSLHEISSRRPEFRCLPLQLAASACISPRASRVRVADSGLPRPTLDSNLESAQHLAAFLIESTRRQAVSCADDFVIESSARAADAGFAGRDELRWPSGPLPRLNSRY